MPTSGWKVISGTQAKLEAVKQKVVERGENFAACVLIPESADAVQGVKLTGNVQCHGCRAKFSLEQQWVLSGGGIESRTVSCPCGNRLEVMLCKRTSGGHFLILTPFTARAGQQVGLVGLLIQTVVAVKRKPIREQKATEVIGTMVSQCPKCGLKYKVPRKRLGQEAKCKCGELFALAVQDGPSPAPTEESASPDTTAQKCGACG